MCFLHKKIRPAMGRTLVSSAFSSCPPPTPYGLEAGGFLHAALLSAADIYQHDFVFISNPDNVMGVSKPAAYNQLCSGF